MKVEKWAKNGQVVQNSQPLSPGEVAFVSGGSDVEVSGFRSETGIVSDSMKDFTASAFDQTLDI